MKEKHFVYVIVGLGKDSTEKVLQVFRSEKNARAYCIEIYLKQDWFFVWIEKHELL